MSEVSIIKKQTMEAMARCQKRINDEKKTHTTTLNELAKQRESYMKKLDSAIKQSELVSAQLAQQRSKADMSQSNFTRSLLEKQMAIQGLEDKLTIQKPIMNSVITTQKQITQCKTDGTKMKMDMLLKEQNFGALLEQEKAAKQEALFTLSEKFKLDLQTAKTKASLEIQSRVTAISTLNQEKRNLDEKIRSNDKLTADLRSVIESKSKEYTAVTSRVNAELIAQRTANVVLTDKLVKLESEAPKLIKQLQDLRKQSADDKAYSKKLGSETDQQIKRRDQTIDKLQVDMTALKASSETKLSKCNALHESSIALLNDQYTKYVSETKSSIAELEKNIRELTVQKKDLSNQLTSDTKVNQEKQKEAQKKFDVLLDEKTKQMFGVQMERDRIQKESGMLHTRIAGITQKLSDVTTKNVQLLDDIKVKDLASQQEFDSLRKRLSFCDSKSRNLENKLTTSEQKVLKLSTEVDETTRSMNSCSVDLRKMTKDSEQCSTTVINLQKKIASLDRALDESSLTAKDQEINLSLAANELNSAKMRSDESNKLREKSMQEAGKLREVATKQDREISELRALLQQATTTQTSSDAHVRDLKKILEDMQSKNSKCMLTSEQCSVRVVNMTDSAKLQEQKISQIENHMSKVESNIRIKDSQHVKDLEKINNENQSQINRLQNQYSRDIDYRITQSSQERDQHSKTVQELSRRHMTSIQDLQTKIDAVGAEMTSLQQEFEGVDRSDMSDVERLESVSLYNSKKRVIDTKLNQIRASIP